MNLERVIFGFFILLALTLNVVFVMGEIDNAHHHSVWILTIAILVNIVATALKLGDRTQVGALLLASSLVADLLLIAARIVWVVAEEDGAMGPGAEAMVTACPKCLIHFACARSGPATRVMPDIPVRDIAEVLAEALGE